MASSIDGKTTKWDSNNIYEWTSPEDSQYFFSLIEQNNLIVMGRHTYEARKPAPQKGKLRVVVTKNPKKYSKIFVAGQLEFVNETPRQLLERLTRKGFKKMLFIGGAILAGTFLEKGLVNQLWLTIEPRIFGSGKPLVSESPLNISLKLLSIKKLNSNGTLLVKYKVLKNS